MRHRKRTADRREDRYIEGEKGQTKTERAREVRDRASPDRGRETDGSLGIDLTQEKEEGQRGVGSGMGIVVGNVSTRRQGVRGFGSALMRRELARDEARGFGVCCQDANWLGMRPEGSGCIARTRTGS